MNPASCLSPVVGGLFADRICRILSSSTGQAISGRILVAEDNKAIQAIVSRFLEFIGLEVALVGNGIEALAVFLESSFDLVLTDLQMPGMDGLSLASHIKERSPITPVILLTGSDRETDLQLFQREKIMQRFILQMSLALALAFAGILATSPALAEKPSGGGGKNAEKHKHQQMGEKHKGKESRDQGASYDRSGHGAKGGGYFSEQKQIFIHEYYGERFRKGRCPPGLAKKGNGCMPPGQAKKWKIGRPLPKDVIFYDLPPKVLVQLGPAPPRHRFVRVAKDILLIRVGTGMVVDAVEDIGREFNR